MNPSPTLQQAGPPEGEIHVAVMWGLTAVLLFLWAWSHRLSAQHLRNRTQRFFGFVGRVALGSLALWTLWTTVGRHLLLETVWSLSLHGLLGGLALETVFSLYSLEKRLVTRSVGRWLTVLRFVSVFAVLTILVQPVFSRLETRKVDRNVVIMLDESESMQQSDAHMPVGERLALADYLGLGGLEGRPALAGLMEEAVQLGTALEGAAEWVLPPDGVNEKAARELIEARKPELTKLISEGAAWGKQAEQQLDGRLDSIRKLPTELRKIAENLQQLAGNRVQDYCREAKEAVERGEGRRLRSALRRAGGAAREAAAESGPLVTALDGNFYAAVPAEVREKISQAAARSRRNLAIGALQRPNGNQKAVLEELMQKYTVKFMQFGSEAASLERLPEIGTSPAGTSAPGEGDMRSRTDLTAALNRVQSTYAPENLAGVVLLSDMRHNGPKPPDDAARQLGLQGSPICPVVVGSSAGARDAAIVDVSHAQSIFLGDRLRVKVDLKLDRMRGQKVKVRLLRDGNLVNESELQVPDDAWRTTIRLDDTPENKGIYAWSVRIDPVEGELFPQNNTWDFQAAVSDDRTNVLLIDGHPRWEFRYLRNLFDSRDKSVQLQYVLLNPDKLAGADPLPDLAAAAGRPFGQSEATRLPATPEEWRKFDVIILGDVPPDVVGEDTWKIIRDCVGNRGAMLVMVAGRNFLPHAFNHESARELVPVKYESRNGDIGTSPEPAFKLALTAEGRQSPVFSQSVSGLESARIWEQMPVLRWRHEHGGAKEGATVLAWAEPVSTDSQGQELSGQQTSLTDADPAGELLRRKAMESKNALVVAAQVDLGKVVMLTFDQTWRFRYGVGDTYHHRFWGQLLRWGAGESLPSGTASVRLGTDQLAYEPNQPVTVKARLVDNQSRPLVNGNVTASIVRDGKPVASAPLEFRKDSQGLYEARFEGLTAPGSYMVELSGPDVEKLLATDGLRTVQQPITIGLTRNAVELGDLTVDPQMASRLASLSGGIVTGPTDLGQILDKFGPETKIVEEKKETSLWDNWIILVITITALTIEWILRRRHALA